MQSILLFVFMYWIAEVLEILSLTKISDKIQEYGIGILIVGVILMKYWKY
jgi:ribose/xylose/arabinose/galactoside ABC-type transport system permease subunit